MLDTASVVSRVHVSILLKIWLCYLPKVDYTHSTNVPISDLFVARLIQGIMPVQHPAMLNPGVAAFSTKEAHCQAGLAQSTEIQPNVVLLSKSYSSLPEMDAQAGAAPELPIPCQSCNTTWHQLQVFTFVRFSHRATELLDSDMAIALLLTQGVASCSVYITNQYCCCNHMPD